MIGLPSGRFFDTVLSYQSSPKSEGSEKTDAQKNFQDQAQYQQVDVSETSNQIFNFHHLLLGTQYLNDDDEEELNTPKSFFSDSDMALSTSSIESVGSIVSPEQKKPRLDEGTFDPLSNKSIIQQIVSFLFTPNKPMTSPIQSLKLVSKDWDKAIESMRPSSLFAKLPVRRKLFPDFEEIADIEPCDSIEISNNFDISEPNFVFEVRNNFLKAEKNEKRDQKSWVSYLEELTNVNDKSVPIQEFADSAKIWENEFAKMDEFINLIKGATKRKLRDIASNVEEINWQLFLDCKYFEQNHESIDQVERFFCYFTGVYDLQLSGGPLLNTCNDAYLKVFVQVLSLKGLESEEWSGQISSLWMFQFDKFPSNRVELAKISLKQDLSFFNLLIVKLGTLFEENKKNAEVIIKTLVNDSVIKSQYRHHCEQKQLDTVMKKSGDQGKDTVIAAFEALFCLDCSDKVFVANLKQYFKSFKKLLV